MIEPAVLVAHARACVDRIGTYVQKGRGEFLRSDLIQDAVLRNLETLTDSLTRLPAELKEHHPTIPWRALSAFRNVLAHQDLGVDPEQVWGVIERDLPVLKSQLEVMAREVGER